MSVVAFWSPTSAGASTVLKGVAERAAERGQFIGVIELNKQFSSLPQQFGIRFPEDKSLEKALRAEDDQEILRNFHKIGAHDLYLLALNDLNRIEDLHDLKEDRLSNLIYLARNKFDVLLLDIPTSYMDFTSYHTIREYADHVVAVIDNNLNGVDKLRRYSQFYRARGMQKDFMVVLNKDMGLLKQSDLEKTLAIKPVAVLPHLPVVSKAGNEGLPLTAVTADKKERVFSQGIAAIYSALFDQRVNEAVPKTKVMWPFRKKG